MPTPQQPELPKMSRRVLDELSRRKEAESLVLGGGVALAHYLPYRQTYDIDFWNRGNREGVKVLREILGTIAQEEGATLVEREARDGTVSLEIRESPESRNPPIFGVNVEDRPVVLAPPLPSSWGGVGVDSLEDNVAAKMTALVYRGLPRDFRDIHEVCKSGLLQPEECWKLFSKRNPSIDLDAGKTMVARNLGEIERRRPISEIPKKERSQAIHVRTWFKQFCKPDGPKRGMGF
jgi:hypothetical protein